MKRARIQSGDNALALLDMTGSPKAAVGIAASDRPVRLSDAAKSKGPADQTHVRGIAHVLTRREGAKASAVKLR